MKNKLPAILFIFFILLIAIGVVSYCRSQNSTATPPDSQKEYPEVGTNGETALLNVVSPNGIESQIKDYAGFKVSFNKENRTPNWVAWELLGSETNGEQSRYNKFWTDEDLDGCPFTSDYTRSGYDRGHLCPSADQKWSETAMIDCFSMANIAPQDHALNTGAWKTLENKERLWAQRDSAIVIIAGPIYTESDRTTIGDSQVRVPGAFFKAMIAPYADTPRGIAFVYPNMTAPGNMENYVMTIREVEHLTGYDFFSALPDDIEELVETKSSFRDWNHRQ